MTRIVHALSDISADYDALFCDVWGCVHNGREAFPEAVAALQAFRAKGGTVVLVTNAPRAWTEVAKGLDEIGVPRDAWDAIATSGDSARTALFTGAGCADEQEFRMLAADLHQARLMSNQRDAITREILAAIGKHEPEEVFAELLRPESIGILESSWEQATGQLEVAQEQLKELAQQRGVLKREREAIEEDRSLAERQLDLSVVEQQLAAARRSWREHAVVNRMLERIRADYEAHRQPETLAEASRYMSELTGGRYVRVWTPLANDILLVETSEGESLPVDVLSRGTREQLFLSVRLALVATFARRGINLPMVLDDVLVNCDAGRAKRAAEVLTRFAAGGRQVLIFTCHEHIWEMFKTLDADCRRLPNRRGGAAAIVEPEPVVEAIEEIVVEPKPKKKRRPRPQKPAPVVEEVVEVVEPEVVEQLDEPVDYYEYPFVERLVEQRTTVPAAVVESPQGESTSFEYSFDTRPKPVDAGEQPLGALAYILPDKDFQDSDERPEFFDWDAEEAAEVVPQAEPLRRERRA